jgi:phage FluMu protein Com|nr:MAG TPA: DNA-directed RNA polymerase [Caudoviricetes sp.]
MEKIKCPNCGLTLIFATSINAEIKCNRCKQIIRIQKEKSEEHAHAELVK